MRGVSQKSLQGDAIALRDSIKEQEAEHNTTDEKSKTEGEESRPLGLPEGESGQISFDFEGLAREVVRS